jgi:4-carboxymuconolactone decarboxylase
MTRIELIASREGLDEETAAVFDWVVESRGEMLRPFEVLLHVPALAQPVAELGHVVRYESRLDPADRELAILATGKAHGCAFVWDSHLDHARRAGVREEAISVLADGPGELSSREQALVGFARSLVAGSAVDDETYEAASDLLGPSGVVELATIIGYYTMLGYAMSVAAAC